MDITQVAPPSGVDADRDPLSRYNTPEERDGRLCFRVFLASRTNLPTFRELVGRELRGLNRHRLLSDFVVIEPKEYDDPDRPMGLAANLDQQTEIEWVLGDPQSMEVVVALLEYSVGHYTKREIERALTKNPRDGKAPRLIVVCPDRSPQCGTFATDADEEQLRKGWADVREVLRQIDAGGGHVQLYESYEAASSWIRDSVEDYVGRHLRARGVLGGRKQVPRTPLDPMGRIYPGLAAMTRQQAHLFFGRDDKRDEFVALLCDRTDPKRVVCIQGASGAGKSSLVMAGILPHLKPDPSAWHVIVMRPDGHGSHNPFGSLVLGMNEALTAAGAEALNLGGFMRQLSEDPRCAIDLVRERFPLTSPEMRRLIYIDQFEELLFDCEKPLANSFVQCLATLTGGGHVSLVATLRADVQEEVCRHERLGGLLSANLYPLCPPEQIEDLRTIVREPAIGAGLSVDAALLDDLLNESLADPNSLPLLALSLEDIHNTWKERRQADATISAVLSPAHFVGFNNVITKRVKRALESCGGLQGRLDEVLERVADVDTVGVMRRRQAVFEEFDDRPELLPLIRTLIEERILVAETGNRIQLVHDRLLEAWPHLRDWFARNRDAILELRNVEHRASRWRRMSANQEEELLSLRAVEHADEAMRRHGWRLAEERRQIVAEFIEESRQVCQRKALAEALRQGQVTDLMHWWTRGVRLSEREIAALKHPACYYALCPESIPADKVPGPGAAAATVSPHAGLKTFAEAASTSRDIGRLSFFDRSNATAVVESGYAPIHFAALGNQVAVVGRLKELGVPLDFSSSNGSRAASLAAYVGALDVLQYLRAQGVDLQAPEADGMTAFHWACGQGHVNVVADFLLNDPGLQVDRGAKDGWTALMLAAVDGHEAAVRLLLANHPRPEIDKVENDGSTALMLAAQNGHGTIVQQLLASEPKPDIDKVESDGWTALMLAAANGHEAALDQLLASQPRPDIDKAANDGMTALMRAAIEGHEGVVQRLLASQPGPDIEKVENDGMTALMLAAGWGHGAIVQQLLASEPRPEIDKVKKDGWTALMMAARYGHEAIVQQLLASEPRPEIDRAGNEGLTAMMLAAANGHADVVHRLLAGDPRPDIDKVGTDGWTALMLAAHCGHHAVVERLLANEPPPKLDALSQAGATALTLAVTGGHQQVAQQLMSRGASLAAASSEARGSALSAAVVHEDVALVRALLAAGADPFVIDASFRSAVALSADKPALVAELGRLESVSYDNAVSNSLAVERSLAGALTASRDVATAVEAAEWPALPLLHAPWRPVAGDQALSVLAKVDAFQAANALHRICLTHDVTSLRAVSLPFYAGDLLYEVLLRPRNGDHALIMPFIEHSAAGDASAAVKLLNYTSLPIHEINETRIRLPDEDAVVAYLRFFCAYVWGDDGSGGGFWVVDDAAQLAWQTTLTSQERAAAVEPLRPEIKPATATKADAGAFILDAAVSYGTAVFAAQFRLERSGTIEMVDDRPIAEDLPVVTDRKLGPFRVA